MRLCKVTIFGAGGTGEQTAIALARLGYSEIVLIDIQAEMAEGKALDIAQSGVLLGEDVIATAGNDVRLAKNSEVVVITAGIGRAPGLSREDLLKTNAHIIENIAAALKVYCPNAFVIVLTNPADILTRIVQDVTGFEPDRVMGQGGILDSARLATLVARRLGVSVRDVRAIVLGGHGDHMVPVLDCVSVHGIPVRHLLTNETWSEIVHKTRFGGGEILEKFKTHGASVTPGWAVAQMVDAISRPIPRLLPISTRPKGTYNLKHDIYIGLPALLSNHGIHSVVELPLTTSEHQQLQQSADALDHTWRTWSANHDS